VTTTEMRHRVSELLVLVSSVADDLRGLRDTPRYDEDYKIEQWGTQLTPANFEIVRCAAVELCVAVERLTERAR
jgi:hypothetical protein